MKRREQSRWPDSVARVRPLAPDRSHRFGSAVRTGPEWNNGSDDRSDRKRFFLEAPGARGRLVGKMRRRPATRTCRHRANRPPVMTALSDLPVRTDAGFDVAVAGPGKPTRALLAAAPLLRQIKAGGRHGG